ncbi:hypothetical protein [Bacillus sp. B15-48]|uniref:hypothetical protein n=1 Tax=Bacillus sp. B15-48 TaxID=1548601 RepID=UPI00193F3855|nr:hypothetical protein [Bacillus sp. B15-48]
MKKQSDYVHLPDLQFIRFCMNQFGINRGIYNTIDSWFYEHGMTNIIERRKKSIIFLAIVFTNFVNKTGN